MSMPLGCQRGSKGQEEPVEPKFLGPRYDQQVLKEAESKKSQILAFWMKFGSFREVYGS